MTDRVNLTRADLEGLGSKLDALDLTEPERLLLDAVFDAGLDEVGVYDVVLQERPNPMTTPPSVRLFDLFNPAGTLARRGMVIDGG